MKRYFFFIIILILVIFSVSIIILHCLKNYNDPANMFSFGMYDHIQHNGIDYYQTEDQNSPDAEYSNEEITVYLVDESLEVYYEYPYRAFAFKGDKDYKYLFFDGAVYIRSDLPKELRSIEHRNKK